MYRHLLPALLALIPTALAAEVTHSGPAGFSVSHSVDTPAPPAAAFSALTRVGEWWNPDHSWSGEAANLYLDSGAEACFCERLPDGGRVEHLRVIYFAPPSEIRFDGALGPLQTMAASGRMSWRVEATDGGSRLSFTYQVFGDPAGKLQDIAPAVDGVIGEQLARLAGRLSGTP